MSFLWWAYTEHTNPNIPRIATVYFGLGLFTQLTIWAAVSVISRWSCFAGQCCPFLPLPVKVIQGRLRILPSAHVPCLKIAVAKGQADSIPEPDVINGNVPFETSTSNCFKNNLGVETRKDLKL